MSRAALATFFFGILVVVASSVPAGADTISTDRFGYTGVVQRYDTLADAQAGTNQVGADIVIGNRDLSIYVNPNYNIVMGSWWYSTEGSAGYGNVRGNSGVGFLQLFDAGSTTDTTLDMSFSGFDGTFWTEFNLLLEGENADYANSSARFWVEYLGGGSDVVVYHDYALSLTAGGLEGLETSPGTVEAFNHPTSVTGTYSGIFENVSTSYPQNNGFYTFDLTLDMTNWAWENREDLTYPEEGFDDSYFAAAPAGVVPEPFSFGIWALLAMIGLAAWRRK